MKRSGFTLVELLATTLLVAVLMTSVVMIVGGMGRDQRAVGAMSAAENADGAMMMLRWDLVNSRFVTPTADGVVLIGNGGIDHRTLTISGRPARVSYRVVHGSLLREQELLDEPARPQRWTELVASGVTRIALEPMSGDLRMTPTGWRTPARMHVQIERDRGVVERILWLR